ncbi:zinc finger BED domain-containing protein 4-like [Anopheles funestus]|uniref:zinc finger BED domain-containing protein 4-like n=1 Tax=Anopheles funestus TaxID=62324 RepID=UPI0020C5CE54|nr:zinc finger BED domain-containing protein 4-like [Anopheles funestus]XP_049290609.1 zinc finger BED domain-containing protein 4-like [Anopheles funestus]
MSDTWQHFVDYGKAGKCRYCPKMIAIANRSTSNLRRHIKSRHPSISLKKAEPSRTSPLTSKVVDQTESEPDGLMNIGYNPVNLASFIDQHEPLTAKKTSQLDEALLEMICHECVPFDIVEGDTFKKFIRLLNPNYELPSRKTLSNGLLMDNYLGVLDTVTESLFKTKSVALTMEGWTSSYNASYLTVTAHYINDDFELCSNLLECSEFSNHCAGHNIADWLKKVMAKFKIDHKIQAIVTNYAVNMKAAMDEINVPHLPCFAHTLNTIVQKAIQNSIIGTIGEIKQIVKYFKENSIAAQKIFDSQNKLNLPNVKLKQNVATRWNSTFDMIERFYKNKIPILTSLDAMGVKHNLSNNDWTIMEESIKVLANYDHATKVMLAEKSPTLSQIGLLTNILLKKTKTLLDDVMDSSVKKLGLSLVEGLSDSGKPYLQNPLVCRAMMLDPRIKGHGFENDMQRYEETYTNLIRTILPLKSQASSALQSVVQNSFASPSHENLFHEFATSVRCAQSKTPEIEAKFELDDYLKMNCIELSEDPYVWWKSNESIFPALFQVVQNVFYIPATSVPCERVFSKAGQIYCEKRSKLLPKKMSEILFLQHNSNQTIYDEDDDDDNNEDKSLHVPQHWLEKNGITFEAL